MEWDLSTAHKYYIEEDETKKEKGNGGVSRRSLFMRLKNEKENTQTERLTIRSKRAARHDLDIQHLRQIRHGKDDTLAPQDRERAREGMVRGGCSGRVHLFAQRDGTNVGLGFG